MPGNTTPYNHRVIKIERVVMPDKFRKNNKIITHLVQSQGCHTGLIYRVCLILVY